MGWSSAGTSWSGGHWIMTFIWDILTCWGRLGDGVLGHTSWPWLGDFSLTDVCTGVPMANATRACATKKGQPPPQRKKHKSAPLRRRTFFASRTSRVELSTATSPPPLMNQIRHPFIPKSNAATRLQ